MKHDVTIRLDVQNKSGVGFVAGINAYHLPPPSHDSRSQLLFPAVQVSKPKTFDIMEFHSIIGHPSQDTTRKTAAAATVKLTGNWTPCEACATANSRQKNIPKVTTRELATKPGEILHIDISHIKTPSFGRRSYWLLVVDDFTNLCWSHFLHNKDDQLSALIQASTVLF